MNSTRHDKPRIVYETNHPITSTELNRLFSRAWAGHVPRNYTPIIRRSLLYLCAYREVKLGSKLVRLAVEDAGRRGIEWLHVDLEPHLQDVYEACGFQYMKAG